MKAIEERTNEYVKVLVDAKKKKISFHPIQWLKQKYWYIKLKKERDRNLVLIGEKESEITIKKMELELEDFGPFENLSPNNKLYYLKMEAELDKRKKTDG